MQVATHWQTAYYTPRRLVIECKTPDMTKPEFIAAYLRQYGPTLNTELAQIMCVGVHTVSNFVKRTNGAVISDRTFVNGKPQCIYKAAK